MKCAEFGADKGPLCARCSHSTPSIEGRVSQQRDGLTGPPTRLQWRQLTLSERGTVINSFEKLSPSSFALSSCRKSSGEVGFSRFLSLSGKTGRSWMDGSSLSSAQDNVVASQKSRRPRAPYPYLNNEQPRRTYQATLQESGSHQ